MFFGAGTFCHRTFDQNPIGASRTIALVAAKASFVLTGIASSLNSVRTIIMDAAAYVLVGIDSQQKFGLPGGPASFSLTGIAATIISVRHIPSSAAAFVLSGKATTITSVRKLTAAVAAFVLTGISSTGIAVHGMSAFTASFALSGKTATRRIVKQAVVPAAFVLSGKSIFKKFFFPVAAAAYSVASINILALTRAPIGKFAIRTSRFILQKSRVTQPTLDQ